MGRTSLLKREARVGSADLQLASALLELWDFFQRCLQRLLYMDV